MGMSETVTTTVCGAAERKTDLVAGGVSASSSSGNRLVVVTVMNTVGCALSVLLVLILVVVRVGELARMVVIGDGDLVLSKGSLAAARGLLVCLLSVLS